MNFIKPIVFYGYKAQVEGRIRKGFAPNFQFRVSSHSNISRPASYFRLRFRSAFVYYVKKEQLVVGFKVLR